MSKPAPLPLPARPYKRLDYYDYEDHPIFFGREEETQVFLSEILSSRLVLLYARSGTGKTSLINAGVRPLLAASGFRTAMVRMGTDPFSAIRQATPPPSGAVEAGGNLPLAEHFRRTLSREGASTVLFLDQFEEFFIHLTPEIRDRFVREIAEVHHDANLPVFLVFSLREDFFVEMDCFRQEIPNIFHNNSNLRLHWFDDEAATQAILRPAERYGLAYEPDLLTRMLGDLRRDSKGIEPIRLQLVCDALWELHSANGARAFTVADYERLGGVAKIEQQAFDEALGRVREKDRQNLLPALLRSLITEAGTKNYTELGWLLAALRVEERDLQKVLLPLQEARLVRASRKETVVFYELSHDYLVPLVQRWLAARASQQNLAAQTLTLALDRWRTTREPIGEESFTLLDQQRALLDLDIEGLEMLAQAAIYYGRNISLALRRLGTETKALEIVSGMRKKFDKDDGVLRNCVEALRQLRSKEAARELVQIALSPGPAAEHATAALGERGGSEGFDELHGIARDKENPAQEKATRLLAELRIAGNRIPEDLRPSVYGYLEWPADSALGSPPRLLGRALTGYEDAESRGLVMRGLRRFQLFAAVPLGAGIIKGAVGAAIGASLGLLSGVLFALYQVLSALWDRSWLDSSFGKIFGSALGEGLKSGLAIGYATGFLIVWVTVLLRAVRASRKLREVAEGVPSS